MDNYSNDTVAQITQTGYHTTSAQSNFRVQTSDSSIVVSQQNQTLKIKDMKLDIAYQPEGGSYVSCEAQTASVTISMLFGGSQVFSKTVTAVKYGY